MDATEAFEFWNNYDGWDWESPADISNFVDHALRTGVYEYSLGAFGYFDGSNSGENWYTNWWYPTQVAIKKMIKKFPSQDLDDAIEILLKPFEDFNEGDQAIYNALLNSNSEVIKSNSLFRQSLKTYLRDWCEFSWFHFESRYFTWTFFGPETIAKSPNTPSEFLAEVFEETFTYDHPLKAFRVRVALAMNPLTPEEIIKFLYVNRLSNDWLLHDPDEEGILIKNGDLYSIDEDLSSITEMRSTASEVDKFSLETDEMWSSCPGANFVENIFGIQWQVSTAKEALFCALAHNPSLSVKQYLELSKSGFESVTYFLSKNASIPEELKKLYSSEKPTFTYVGVGDEGEITLN
jgi:hypothetical protein